MKIQINPAISNCILFSFSNNSDGFVFYLVFLPFHIVFLHGVSPRHVPFPHYITICFQLVELLRYQRLYQHTIFFITSG